MFEMKQLKLSSTKCPPLLSSTINHQAKIYKNPRDCNKIYHSSLNIIESNVKLPHKLNWSSVSLIISLSIILVLAPGQCYGSLLGIEYRYHYSTSLTLNNNNNLEPAGFRCQGQVVLENLWQDNSGYLARIELDQFRFQPRNNIERSHPDGPVISGDNWPPVLAHISVHDGHLERLFIEKQTSSTNKQHLIEPTHLNLIVAIFNALRNRRPNDQLPYEWIQQGRSLVRESINQESTSSRFSLFAPIIKDSWQIRSELAEDHDTSTLVHGWQNVSLESKIYPSAHSKLFVDFELKLLNEAKSSTSSKLSKASSISQAVYLYGNSIRSKTMVSLGSAHFHAERKPCQPHFCQPLPDFLNEYGTQLAEDKSLATNSISVAFLRLLNYLRTNSGHVTRKDLSKLLTKLDQTRKEDGNRLSTMLDAIAASRHGEAMLAALDYLNLPKCSGESRVGDCERFLAVVAISGSTVANMGSSHVAEHSLSVEQLLDVLVPLLIDKQDSAGPKWSDDRVKHSFALTIATLLHSYQLYVKTLLVANETLSDHQIYDSSRTSGTILRHHSSPTWFVDVSADEPEPGTESIEAKNGDKSRDNIRHHQQKLTQISEKILKHFQHELDTMCNDAECRVVYLHALGNTRIISKHGMLNTLKRYAVNNRMKRESVAAMKAMRNCIHFEWNEQNLMSNEKLVNRLKQLLIRILYDSTLETTTRLLASELLANYIDSDGDVTIELVQHLDKFPSELATMIWKRAVRNVLIRRGGGPVKSKNWHLHSKILSGSSASFRYVMGGTDHVNASYGVFLELLKAKLPKETLFNVDISRDLDLQDVISVGLFARGLQSLAGESSGDDEHDDEQNEIPSDEEESTLAGMTLQILGQQLRPYVFFRSTSELMGHLWSGAASEPTPVFRANLLLADYLDMKPLINGFLVEQSLKGIFSLDLSGEVQVSLWNRNSHSNVQTNGAILFQGSQEIFTTDYKTSARKMFSFGAESKLNFITDFDFYSSPFRICIQITQPQFVFRHNTRKYEQWHSDDLHRRIHRRSYKIPAKSYILNRDNSEMCAMMNAADSSATSNQDGGFDFEF